MVPCPMDRAERFRPVCHRMSVRIAVLGNRDAGGSPVRPLPPKDVDSPHSGRPLRKRGGSLCLNVIDLGMRPLSLKWSVSYNFCLRSEWPAPIIDRSGPVSGIRGPN